MTCAINFAVRTILKKRTLSKTLREFPVHIFPFQNIERVLLPHLSVYLPHLFATMDEQGIQYVGLQDEAYKVHGTILVRN